MIQSIDGLANHPGLSSAVGMRVPGWSYVPGTEAANFASRLDQLQGQAFLQAFESLKGGGQITEVEGKKATDAIARLSQNQSEAAFKGVYERAARSPGVCKEPRLPEGEYDCAGK